MHLTRDAAGRTGESLRIDFDFNGRAGYAIARRDGVLELPENFEFVFWLKANAPRNTLEFKLIDETGENVWWSTKRDYEFPTGWRRIAIKKRHLEFAWGPLGGGPVPKRIAAIEIVVTAGSGGKGTVWLDDVQLAPLDTVEGEPPAPVINREEGRVTIDLVRRRELGGLTIQWGATAPEYSVSTSLDGNDWETTRIRDSDGGRDDIYLPDGDARWIRIDAPQPVSDVIVRPADWSRTPNDFFSNIAKESPRGMYPRYLLGQQSYWTVMGADGNPVEALISEDGAVEAGDARFSIEPFILLGDRRLTWADVRITQSLAHGDLPIPTVTWTHPEVKLTITAFVAGDAKASTLYTHYKLEGAEGARLQLAIRPFQVNTPWQFLKRTGGVVPIRRIAREGDAIVVDADQRGAVIPLTPLRSMVTRTFPGAEGYASAELEFDARAVGIAVPLNGPIGPEASPERSHPSHPSYLLAATTRQWQTKLSRFTIHVPAAPELARTIRSNVAYILINRDGPSIQPGSRAYDRSWIRDGSLTSTALLRLDFVEPVRDFVRWYATHLREDGYAPCCVSFAGADPVPEHDSHGQFIYLVAEIYRHTRDRKLVEELWPDIVRIVGFLDRTREPRRGNAFDGMMPASISHEGYSAKPMHSYWDDFFVLRGLKDAAYLASIVGKDTKRYDALRDEFRRDLLASLALAMKNHNIDYIPGSAELGDFDATSTTVAVSPVDETESLPRAALTRTFDKYMENFRLRRDGKSDSELYTPYEWRVVGTLVRLGRIAEAHEVMRWIFLDQRPRAWNHWSEGVWHDPRRGGFIGDMPHTWVGSDFIRSALDLFVYEHEDQLILGAGVLPEWLDRGLTVDGISTPWGEVGYTLRRVDGKTVVEMLRTPNPPGGIVHAYPK
ncbi:MAG TPA: discoidin domain-containing protein [Thermoanaerobaculia bacterium]